MARRLPDTKTHWSRSEAWPPYCGIVAWREDLLSHGYDIDPKTITCNKCRARLEEMQSFKFEVERHWARSV